MAIDPCPEKLSDETLLSLLTKIVSFITEANGEANKNTINIKQTREKTMPLW